MIEMPSEQLDDVKNEMSASEALFGFCGWLTSRNKPLTMSSSHECGSVLNLISRFCKTNNLTKPRNDWEKNLIQPEEACEKEACEILRLEDETLDSIVLKNAVAHEALDKKIYSKGNWAHIQKQERGLRSVICKALKMLEGDLSYANVSKAKKCLKLGLALAKTEE